MSERSCGKCYVCCYVGGVSELEKPPYTDCKYIECSECRCCKIFDKPERPKVCSKFECAWKRGFGKEEDRPDLSGVMVSTNDLNGGIYGFAIELKPHAVFESGKNIILDMVCKLDVPVIISNYGVKPPNDTGNRVVVKEALLHKSRNMRSTFLNALSDNVGIYILKDNPKPKREERL